MMLERNIFAAGRNLGQDQLLASPVTCVETAFRIIVSSKSFYMLIMHTPDVVQIKKKIALKSGSFTEKKIQKG